MATGWSRRAGPRRLVSSRPRSRRALERRSTRSTPTRPFSPSSFRALAPAPAVVSLPPMRKRLDVLLVERGLAETRAQAQALVMAGLVPGHVKPGEQVDEAAPLEVERPLPYVSRGGQKLEHALDVFRVDVSGLDCLDVGASTGGFTDCLLKRGAERVIALDVAHGQLEWSLRNDPRVTVIERHNARELEPASLPYEPSLATADVSFISLAKVM